MDYLGLTQIVDQPTRGNVILDLVLVSHPAEVVVCDVIPPIANSDHMALLLRIDIPFKSTSNKNSDHVDFDRANVEYAAHMLSLINWIDEFAECRHVDDYVTAFMFILHEILQLSLPAIHRRPNKPRNLITKQIRKLVVKKRRLWKKAKNGSSTEAYRAVCKEVKRSMRLYVASYEYSLTSNSNQATFYRYLNKNLGRSYHPLRLVDEAGNVIEEGIETAEAFNNEFVKNFAFTSALTACNDMDNEGPGWNVSLYDTMAALSSSSNSAAGPDGISGNLLRSLAPVIALPVSIIFQQSLAQGVFPTEWKKAVVTPIYKGRGDRMSPSSYRPVSLCSTMGKALESIVKNSYCS
jgi:hypothetical protein